MAEAWPARAPESPSSPSRQQRRRVLTRTGTAIWVILPIALRNALPSVGNNFISLFKDTSIAAVIAVPELTFQARKINNESFRVIEVWMIASLMYVFTCALIATGLRRLEAAFPKF